VRVCLCVYPAKMDVMQTAEPTASPANSPTCIHDSETNSVRIVAENGDKQQPPVPVFLLTALVSVATARVTNIMLKVTMTSMMSECQCGPAGVVVPSTAMGCSTALSTNDAQMAPVNCAAQ
jgi:hypothetical protein